MSTGRLAWGLWALAVLLTASYSMLVVLDAGSGSPLGFAEEWILTVLYGVLMLTLPTVGALIASRQPGNAIGWLFCAAGVAMAAGFTSVLYGAYGTYVRPGLPGARYALLGDHLFVVGLSLATIFLLFLFPTGRPLTRRWRIVVLGLAALFVIGFTGSLLRPGPVDAFGDVTNPLGLAGVAGRIAAGAAMLFDATAPPAFLLGVWALLARFRRSYGIERQQLKWFAYAAGLMSSVLAAGFTLGMLGFELASDVLWVCGMLTLAFLPVAVGLAILRHGLYEIDRIVSRTVSYALLSGLLAGVYAVAVLLLSRLLAPLGAGSELAVAASTLAVAAAFQPVRRRIQQVVDRRFNRARYDAEQIVARFKERLRDEHNLEDLHVATRQALAQTVEPSGVSVWLRPD
jgi:hypothetical protein